MQRPLMVVAGAMVAAAGEVEKDAINRVSSEIVMGEERIEEERRR